MKILSYLLIGLLGMPFLTGATQMKLTATASDQADDTRFFQKPMVGAKKSLPESVYGEQTSLLPSRVGIKRNGVQAVQDQHGLQLAHHGRWQRDDRHWRDRRYHDKRRRYDDRHHKRHYRSHFKHYRDRPKYYKKHHHKHHPDRYWNGRHWTYCRPGSRHPKCLWRYPYKGYDRSGVIIYYRD